MSGPQDHLYGNQQQQYQQQYQQYPPHQQQYPPQYNAPPPMYAYHAGYQPQQPYRPRSPRQNWAVTTARSFNIAIPVVIIILSIWWSIRSQTCPDNASIGHPCSWRLWTALPVACVAAIWSVVMNISARRATHSMSSVPPIVSAVMELIIALGATACFAILIYHLDNYQVWGRTSESIMVALLAILALINYVLFAWTIYETRFYRKQRQNANSQIPI
ncbi:hypothetical protein FSPOR_1908 [Fusarium sporotrichioides]|uniref:MARVEL domain-containing protein n=1 Tax=Fusarium sporotrichioides TaxID=5514 RepID=A0A395SP31_FUSSP|nr:hypothetical protein FSPOR_1908 [Fusarium sporotrichioides]